MKAFAQLIGKLLEGICVAILAIMSILVFLNVVLRYGFNSSISVTEEVSRYLFVWLTFLGAVLAFNERQHVSVNVFVEKLSARGQSVLRLLTDGMMLFCCYLIISGSWIQFQLNLNNLAPISGLPQGITYLASVVAGGLIGLLLIARIFSGCVILAKGETL